MKPFSKSTNKWILSTLMIAALGSQYYFSVSSNSFGSFELSSTASEELTKEFIQRLNTLKETPNIKPEEITKKREALIAEFTSKFNATVAIGKPQYTPQQLEAFVKKYDAAKDSKVVLVTQPKKTEEAKPVVAKPVDEKATAEAAKMAAAAKAPPATSETEGKSISTLSVMCPACDKSNRWIVLPAGVDRELADKIATALNVQPASPAVEEKKEEHGIETATERKEREKAERLQKKADAKQAKLDKEREKKDARNEAFAEKADDIAERCQDDLACKADRFASLMNSYTGKDKSVDSYVAMKAYNTIIDKDLRAGLRGEDGSSGKTAALEAIESLMGQIPREYKALKVRTVDTAKYAQTAQATAINDLYKQADVYKTQRRTNDELVTRDLAMRSESTFRQDANTIYQSIYDGLTGSRDQATMDYVRNTYIPDIRTILSRLSNLTGITTVDSGSTGNRGGRTGNTTTVNTGTNLNPVQSGSNNSGTVNFGPPTTNRTINRTGMSK